MRAALLVDDEAHQGSQPEYAGQNAERGPAPAGGRAKEMLSSFRSFSGAAGGSL